MEEVIKNEQVGPTIEELRNKISQRLDQLKVSILQAEGVIDVDGSEGDLREYLESRLKDIENICDFDPN